MRSCLALMFFAAIALVGGPAAAEPAYRAKDVADKFARAIQGGGATRGICIGTEAECGGVQDQNAANAAPDATFQDLLVTFDLDSAELTEAAKQNLDEFALALQDPRLTNASFAVEGHTDARGSDAYNLDLSQRRAAAVVSYLQSKGVDTSKLDVKGFGKSRPRTSDPFDPENRRVEARLLQ